MNISKRLLLAGAAPFALAAVYGGSIAFAQSGDPAPTTDSGSTQREDPAPTTPGRKGHGDCPEGAGHGSGTGESETGDSGTSTQIRMRARHGAPANAGF